MQAIKSLVIGMGILIIAGLILLGYAFYARMTDPEFKLMKEQREQASASRASARSGAGDGFGEVRLGLPEGCSVVEMKPDGKWLYLRTGPAGPCERVLIIDTLTGRIHGTLVGGP